MAVVTGANSGIGFFAARELARAGGRVVLAVRSAEKGAETLVWLATSANVVKTNGGYCVDMEWRPPSPQGQNVEAARRLWEISEAQCAGRIPEARL